MAPKPLNINFENPNVDKFLFGLYSVEHGNDGTFDVGKLNIPYVERGTKNVVTSTARGGFQFIKSTRDEILNKYGYDAWSDNIEEQKKATMALIISTRPSAATLIENGEFEKARKNIGGVLFEGLSDKHKKVFNKATEDKDNWSKIKVVNNLEENLISKKNKLTNYVNEGGYTVRSNWDSTSKSFVNVNLDNNKLNFYSSYDDINISDDETTTGATDNKTKKIKNEIDVSKKPVEDYEKMFGSDANLININGRPFVTYTDKDGNFQQLSLEKADKKIDNALKKDDKITRELLEESDSELIEIGEEEEQLVEKTKSSKKESSLNFEEGKILKMGKRNYYVFKKDEEFFALPESIYNNEIKKFDGGNIPNNEFLKKLPLNEKKLNSLIESRKISYDKNYSVNALPPADKLDLNKINLAIDDSDLPDDFDISKKPDFSELTLDPEKDGNLFNFLNKQIDKDKTINKSNVQVAKDTPNKVKLEDVGEEEENVIDNTTVLPVDTTDTADIATTEDIATSEGIATTGGLLDSIGGFSTIASALVGANYLGRSNNISKEISDNPELSDAFDNMMYQQEQASKMGFSPKEEAAYKQQIADSYTMGMENAARGTGGDRAKYLAMSGVLDAQRQSALLDFAARDEAVQKQNQDRYNQTLMFKENFDIQRQQQQRAEEMEAIATEYTSNQQLASQAFKYAADNIANAKADKLQNQLIQKMIGNQTNQTEETGLNKVASSLINFFK